MRGEWWCSCKLFIFWNCWKVWGHHADHRSLMSTQICPTISNNLTHLRKNSLTWNRIYNNGQVFFYKNCHTGVFDCLFFPPLQRVFFKIQCCFRKVFFHLMIYEYYLDVNVKKNCFNFYLETCTWLISRSWPWKSCPSF